ncbi:40S ribosomal S10-like protein, putative [Medicago truncatula]|uniref:40S ribosomal S10-like protein, putative n=1 Tax=Medicago truncatula TaxID=3880 RepID=G7IXM8_MEDTR|nr:40S ribosomal S10-like protein, putative [Medicago truncatula]
MADLFDVHAQLNGGEPQRLKVRCLSVTLRGLKDQLNEFNQGVNPGDTRNVTPRYPKVIKYKIIPQQSE